MKSLIAACFLYGLHLFTTNGAKILGVFVVPVVSHQIVYQPIWKELSLRGHEVTVITSKPLNDPTLTNLTEIDVGFAKAFFDDLTKPYVERPKISPWLISTFFYYATGSYIKVQLEDARVRALIQDERREFDVVLVEPLHPLVYGFGGRFRCPMVGILSKYADVNLHTQMGNPSHPVASPEIQLRFPETLHFFQRVESVLFSIYNRAMKKLMLPFIDRDVKKYFGSRLPHVSDLERDLSLLLINTHPLLHGVRPKVPTVIELGKVERVQTNESVSRELVEFLDSAIDGVIYFSLGSLMKPSVVFGGKLDFIQEILTELPQKLLWKSDNNSTFKRRFKNVMANLWVPQQYVLNHPNVKAFITQGGPQSIEEAATAGVPVLMIPNQFDQFTISQRAVAFGVGRMLYIEDMDKESFKEALLDVVHNPKYKEKITQLGRLMNDQPMNGLDTAVWWIEYVIRHNGTKHLTSPQIDIPFYQYFFLDIIAAFFLIILGIRFGFKKITERKRKRFKNE